MHESTAEHDQCNRLIYCLITSQAVTTSPVPQAMAAKLAKLQSEGIHSNSTSSSTRDHNSNGHSALSNTGQHSNGDQSDAEHDTCQSVLGVPIEALNAPVRNRHPILNSCHLHCLLPLHKNACVYTMPVTIALLITGKP